MATNDKTPKSPKTPPTPVYLKDGVWRNTGRWVRCWAVRTPRSYRASEYVVQIWNTHGPDGPSGDPDGEWTMPSVLGVTGCIEQALLQTPDNAKVWKPEHMWKDMVEEHALDANGNPAGGMTYMDHLNIRWQNGPLGREPDRKEPNGACVEDVIAAAMGRLMFYQSTKFKCVENAKALDALRDAQHALFERTHSRTERGVEGTYEL